MPTYSSLLSLYLATYPNEQIELTHVVDQTRTASDEWLVSRHNFAGHLTASGLVFSPCLTQVLLIKHKTLGIFLQPGGHFDHPGESPLQVALREIEEESGLPAAALERFPPADRLPFHINTHAIPANPRRGEPAHWHHDCCYLFRCLQAPEQLQIATEENAPCVWLSTEQMLSQHPFTRLPARIRPLLNL